MFKMKTLRLEAFLVAEGDMSLTKCTAAIAVYNQYEGGNPIYEKTFYHKGDPTEIIAYILKKYVINKNLKWNRVIYDKENYLLILYGVDKRIR